MSAARVLGVLLPLVFLIAAAGIPLMLWWEKRRLTSYTRQPHVLADWHAMSSAEQEAVDTASLDMAEQAALDAEADAQEAAQQVVERSRVNALFHP
jgi:hypothetical protein